MPLVTRPKGEKPRLSSAAFFPRLTKTCVERVLGPASAYVIVPSVFEAFTGSSLIVAFCQARDTAGSGLIPNWTTKPLTTRKKVTPSKKCARTRLEKRSAPRGAQARCTVTTNVPFVVLNETRYTAGA